jgi:hypothetical protein
MHDVLRQRLMRRIESLPEEQVYHVLDYIEFLESKYARSLNPETTGLQRFAENLEDKMRKKAMNPATIREAFQLIAAADRVLSTVSSAGRQLITELGMPADEEGGAGDRSELQTGDPEASEGTASRHGDRSGSGAPGSR